MLHWQLAHRATAVLGGDKSSRLAMQEPTTIGGVRANHNAGSFLGEKNNSQTCFDTLSLGDVER